MDYFFLYLLGQDIRAALGATITVLWAIAFFVYVIKSLADESFILPPTTFIVIYSILVFITMIVPSQDSLKYMWAYYVGKQVVQSETTQKLITILNQRLDKEIKDNLPK